MLYGLLKLSTRLALFFFAKRINLYNKERLDLPGPLLIAANHPNSFLDAILIGSYMKGPVHFISRGDVFKKPWVRKTLRHLNMIPIYRMRDGREKLTMNDKTIETGIEVMRRRGILLVFVEGFCEHQTTLQLPLKKGAPRILQACWQQGIEAKILPVWLQYSSFDRIGKTMELRLGAPIEPEICAGTIANACHTRINNATARALLALQSGNPFVHKPPPPFQKALLYLPAIGGAMLHAPLYLPLSGFTKYISRDNVHHDSLLFCLLFFSYPFYLAAILLGLYVAGATPVLCICVALALPLMALAFIHWKD
jgi:1-acyl-sn-glycerol-3-phosphate acyltransferase